MKRYRVTVDITSRYAIDISADDKNDAEGLIQEYCGFEVEEYGNFIETLDEVSIFDLEELLEDE